MAGVVKDRQNRYIVCNILFSTELSVFVFLMIRPPPRSTLRRSSAESAVYKGQALIPPLILIFCVLGTIMFGVATPTEAAGVGAIGTVLMTIFYGSFNLVIMQEAFLKTLQITAMILTILLGGVMFAGVFVDLGCLKLLLWRPSGVTVC